MKKFIRLILLGCLIFFIALLIRGRVIQSYHGFIKITDKQVIEHRFIKDKYVIKVDYPGEEFQIKMAKSNKLEYTSDIYSNIGEEILIEEIWSEFEVDEMNYVHMNRKGFFGNDFKIVFFNSGLEVIE
ncbi:hypothetical protein [Marinilactibacillus kalidii]|uniref:hypothetical protein n=1 Tax=Marinilactibacillus kalidii TaxID=2820274 RepID=UPI001ABD9D87|nr:hypothetical protein [Marinilactibacillus kalidii]